MAKDKKKSIIEEALLDAKLLRETLNNNTKEILRSVSREEINGAINESFGDDEEEDIDVDMEDTGDDSAFDAGADSDFGAEDTADDFGGGAEADLDAGSEEGSEGFEDMEGMSSDEDDFEFDMTTASDEEVISVFKKLQNDDEIQVINDKEVHINAPDGSEYHVKLGGGGAAAPEVGADLPAEEDEFDIDSDLDAGGDDFDSEGGEDMDYEIELDGDLESDEEGDDAPDFGGDEEGDDFGAEEDEDEITEDIVRGKGHDKYAGGGSLPSGNIEGQKAEKDSDSGDNLTGGFDDDAVSHANAEGPMVMSEEEEDELNEEDEIEEQIRQGVAQSRRVPGKAKIGQPNGPGAVVEAAQYNKLLNAYKALMSENKEFKGALKEFRTMLNEVAIFNSNLTYATRLFTEHSTTREEKQEILKRFDNEAGSLKESKKVFKSIQEGLKKKTPMNETLGNKIQAEVKTSSKSQINESTAYVDNSTKRMLELMRKLK